MLRKAELLVSVWLILAGAGLAFPAPSLADADAEALVNTFHASLTRAMQSASFESRLEIMNSAVDRGFDLPTISRISLGRNWRALTPDQQAEYSSLMGEFIKTTYASRFDNWSGQVFETVSSEPIGKNRLRVKTILTTTDEVVNLDYQLINRAGSWHIYDVVANGVSDLSLKRANYAAIYKADGLAAVEADIRSEIAENRVSE